MQAGNADTETQREDYVKIACQEFCVCKSAVCMLSRAAPACELQGAGPSGACPCSFRALTTCPPAFTQLVIDRVAGSRPLAVDLGGASVRGGTDPLGNTTAYAPEQSARHAQWWWPAQQWQVMSQSRLTVAVAQAALRWLGPSPSRCKRIFNLLTYHMLAERHEQRTVEPVQQLNGTVKLPGSKSLSNRILLLAALADGTTDIENLLVGTSPHAALPP